MSTAVSGRFLAVAPAVASGAMKPMETDFMPLRALNRPALALTVSIFLVFTHTVVFLKPPYVIVTLLALLLSDVFFFCIKAPTMPIAKHTAPMIQSNPLPAQKSAIERLMVAASTMAAKTIVAL